LSTKDWGSHPISCDLSRREYHRPEVFVKRCLVFTVSFDTRSQVLALEVKDDWEEKIRHLWIENKQQIVNGLAQEYGIRGIDQKVTNFLELGREPFSVVAFHNRFLRQCRDAFVASNYYPALTGACALGERILNHLVLKLRDYHKGTASYKRVYGKESFDNWNTAINVLEEWQVFVDEDIFSAWQAFIINRVRQSEEETDLHTSSGVADLFRRLYRLRNDSLHFRVDLDIETRGPALRAIQLLQDIVAAQFGIDGPLPWFIPGARGSHFIKEEFEDVPFIREFYLPACVLVGPNYQIERVGDTLQISDPGPYEEREVSDEQFVELLNAVKDRQSESRRA
jgi:hypothetical protein